MKKKVYFRLENKTKTLLNGWIVIYFFCLFLYLELKKQTREGKIKKRLHVSPNSSSTFPNVSSTLVPINYLCLRVVYKIRTLFQAFPFMDSGAKKPHFIDVFCLQWKSVQKVYKEILAFSINYLIFEPSRKNISNI